MPQKVYLDDQGNPRKTYLDEQGNAVVAAPAPTLIESRRQASAGEVRQNQPESTMLTRTRESILGGFESMGGDPSSPVVGTGRNILAGILGLPGLLKSVATDPVGTGTAVVGGALEGPKNIAEGIRTGDSDLIARGGGQTGFPMLTAAISAAKLRNPAGDMRDWIRTQQGKVPKRQLQIEQLLSPRGKEAQATAMQIAPDLAKNPALARLNQIQFDKKLVEDFRKAQGQLQVASTLVPQGTKVAKGPILDRILNAMDEQSPFSSNPEIVANPRAEAVLNEWFNKLDKLPDNVAFEELRKFRQQLDADIANHRGWDETASIADRAEMMAKKHVVNSIRAELKGISKALDKADEAYGLAADSIGAAGIDPKTGRRVAGVGKKEKPGIARKAAEYAGKAAIGGTAMGAGYELYERLRN